jgi:hypothetical protein
MKNHKFITSLKNLLPLTTYSYSIESVNGNWPVVASPASGSFYTLKDSYDIETTLRFCASSGTCSGITKLAYSPTTCSSGIIPFVDARIVLNLPYSNIKLYGDVEHVECLECLIEPSIETVDNIELNNDTGNVVNLDISFNNLNNNSTYNYTIELLEGNTLLGSNNLSGTIITTNNYIDTIQSRIALCETTGECAAYTTTLGSIFSCDTNPYAKLRVKLESDCLDNPTYSNPTTINCDYCWPRIIFETENNVTLTNSNEYDIGINLINLKPYSTYQYSIENIQSNSIIGFDSISGSFTTNETVDTSIIPKLVFCDISGYYNNYTIINNHNICDINKYVKFNVTINSDCLENPISSQPITIVCEDCLPNRHSVVLDTVNIYQADSAIDLTGNLSNLLSEHTYSYQFESKGGNWPIKIYPVSGSFIAKTQTKEILSQAWFCCPSGSCGSTPFTKTYDSLRYKTNYLTQDIRLKVTDTCANHLVYDDRTIFIQLADLEITPVNDTYNVILDSQTKGCYDFSMKVNNCINTHSYTYQYHAIDGNWPVILSNVSGSFTNQPLIHNIKTQLTFCPSTGVCNNQSNVLTPPSVLSYNSLLNSTCNNSKFISLQLSVTSNCYPNQKAFFSEPITVYCEDCIPLPSITLDIEK